MSSNFLTLGKPKQGNMAKKETTKKRKAGQPTLYKKEYDEQVEYLFS